MTLKGRRFERWNHRVILHTEEREPYFAIHECHYSDGAKIPHSWRENAVPVLEGTLPELRKTLERMLTCCALPVLVIDGDKLKEWSGVMPAQAHKG